MIRDAGRGSAQKPLSILSPMGEILRFGLAPLPLAFLPLASSAPAGAAPLAT